MSEISVLTSAWEGTEDVSRDLGLQELIAAGLLRRDRPVTHACQGAGDLALNVTPTPTPTTARGGSGALLLHWISPPNGIGRILLILGFIIVSAYADAWLGQRTWPKKDKTSGKVVSLEAYRNHSFRTRGPFRHRGRIGTRSVFQSQQQDRAHEVSQAFLAEGLNPRVVQRHRSQDGGPPTFEVRLPEDEV